MLIDPTRVTLRSGNTSEFLTIDYQHKEVGHLRIDADGGILSSWAIHYPERPLIDLVARCVVAVAPSRTGSK